MFQGSSFTLLTPSRGRAGSPISPMTMTCIKTWSTVFIVSCSISDVELKELREFNRNDPTMQMLHAYSMEGWPHQKHDVSPPLKSFWNVQNDIHVINGILLKDNRLVIPSAWKKYSPKTTF